MSRSKVKAPRRPRRRSARRNPTPCTMPNAIMIPVSEQLLAMARSMQMGFAYGKKEKRQMSRMDRAEEARKQYLPSPKNIPAILGILPEDLAGILTLAESVTSQDVGNSFFDQCLIDKRYNGRLYKSVYAHLRLPETANVPIFLVPVGSPTSPALRWPATMDRQFIEATLNWVWMASYRGDGYGVMVVPPTDNEAEDRKVSAFMDRLGEQMKIWFSENRVRVISRTKDRDKPIARDVIESCTLRLAPANHYLPDTIYPDEFYESDIYTPGLYTDRLILNVLSAAVCYRAGEDLIKNMGGLERADYESRLKNLKAEYQINSIADLENFLRDPENKLAQGAVAELLAKVDTFKNRVTYNTLRAASQEKEAKKALKEYLYGEIPRRPEGCVRDTIAADDGMVASAQIFTLAPYLPEKISEFFICMKSVRLENVPFTEAVAKAQEMSVAAQAMTGLSTANVIRYFSDESSLKYLSNAAKSGALTAMTYMFVSLRGAPTTWPDGFQKSVEKRKGFYLYEDAHIQKPRDEKDFLVQVLANQRTKVVTIGHRDARVLYEATEPSKETVAEGCLSFAPSKKYGAIRDSKMFAFYAQMEREQASKLETLEGMKGSDPAYNTVAEETSRLSKSITKARERYETLKQMQVKHPFYFLWAMGLFTPPPRGGGSGLTGVLAEQAEALTRARSAGRRTEVGERVISVEGGGFRAGSLSRVTSLLKDGGMSGDPIQRSSAGRSSYAETPKLPKEEIVKAEDAEARRAFIGKMRTKRRDTLAESKLDPQSWRVSRMMHPAAWIEAYPETEELFAQLNPRRKMTSKRRYSRKPRRARRNPTDDYKRLIDEYLSADKDLPEQWTGNLPEVEYSQTPAVFRRKGESVEDFNAISVASRLREQPYVRYVTRPSVTGFDSFSPDDIGLLAAQAGLSLTEAQALARRYKDAATRRHKTSIPASSALCGANRRPKLKNYRLPDAVRNFPGVDAPRKVLIWISPEDVTPVRVMTYRRNTHIDCDLVSDDEKGRSYGQLLALAIQDTLMWLAQKTSRQENTLCYVGRIGSPEVYMFWSPGQGLSYESALTALKGNRAILQNYDSDADVRAYREAAGLQLSATPPRETPLAVPLPASSSEGEEGVTVKGKEEVDMPF